MRVCPPSSVYSKSRANDGNTDSIAAEKKSKIFFLMIFLIFNYLFCLFFRSVIFLISFQSFRPIAEDGMKNTEEIFKIYSS